MSQVINIFRAAMAQRAAADAVNPHQSVMAPSSAFDRLMAAAPDSPPLFDSTPCGIECCAPEGGIVYAAHYYVDPAGDGPQVPEEC